MPTSRATTRARRGAKKFPPNVARPIYGDVDPESFPDEVEGLADDTIVFLNCSNEFPEFSDESVNASIVLRR